MTHLNFVNFKPRTFCAGLLVEDRLKPEHLSEAHSFVAHELASASVEDLLSHGWQHDADPELDDPEQEKLGSRFKAGIEDLVKQGGSLHYHRPETPLLDQIFYFGFKPGAQLLLLGPLSERSHVAAILELRGGVSGTMRSLLGLQPGSTRFNRRATLLNMSVYIPQ